MSKNYPDRSWIIFNFLLGESGKSKDEWFQLPADVSNPTEKEIEKLGYYKARLISLGVPEDQVNSVGQDELVGLTGTFKLETKNGYQNIRNFKLNTDGMNEFAQPEEAEEAPAEAPAAKAPAKAAAPKAAAPKATAPAARAAAAGVRTNPFAKG